MFLPTQSVTFPSSFDNPNSPSRVKELSPDARQAALDRQCIVLQSHVTAGRVGQMGITPLLSNVRSLRNKLACRPSAPPPYVTNVNPTITRGRFYVVTCGREVGIFTDG